MTHALIGTADQGPTEPAQIDNTAHAQTLLGRLDASPTSAAHPILVALSNLFSNGARRAFALRLPAHPTDPDAILPHLPALAKLPDLQSIAIPGLRDPKTLLAIAAAMNGLTWASHTPGAATPTPFLWADLPDDAEPSDAEHLVQASSGRIVPVVPGVRSHAPGRMRAEPYPASTFAQAALTALPRPVSGIHDPTIDLPLRDRRIWLAAGAAVIHRRRGHRPVLAISLPERLAQTAASPPVQSPIEALHSELNKIVKAEEAGPAEGRDGRTVRKLQAALNRAFNRGILYGDRPEKAFKVRLKGPGDIEVQIQKPPRSPGGLQISFAFPKGPTHGS